MKANQTDLMSLNFLFLLILAFNYFAVCIITDAPFFIFRVAENLGGKQLVMQLLTHEDPNVRYEALLCVQKLMVQNWEYLGKQLEKDTKKELQVK